MECTLLTPDHSQVPAVALQTIAAANCAPPDFASSAIVVLSSSVPFFNHRNMVSLAVISHNLLFNLNEKSTLRQNFRLITIHITLGKGQMGRLLIVFSFDVIVTRPLPRNGGMAKDHGALEAGQLPRAWTTYMSTYTLSPYCISFFTFPNVYRVLGFFEVTCVSKNFDETVRFQSEKRQEWIRKIRGKRLQRIVEDTSNTPVWPAHQPSRFRKKRVSGDPL